MSEEQRFPCSIGPSGVLKPIIDHSVRLPCYLEWRSGLWQREITFPFPPFPGMIVGGGLVVDQVIVCQGSLDGDGEVKVRLKDQYHETETNKWIMEGQGWLFEDTSE